MTTNVILYGQCGLLTEVLNEAGYQPRDMFVSMAR